MSRVTRRTAIGVLAGGTVAVAIGGAVAIRATSPAGLVRGTLERYLGPVRISEADLDAFIADFTAGKDWLMPDGKLAQGYELANAVGLGGPAASVLAEEDRSRIELFERRVLGAFHSRTDVGWRQSAEDEVTYLGASGCGNPFATLAV
ncbi:MAG: hypothetical protein WBA25_09220 [Jannaschia sp.]